MIPRQLCLLTLLGATNALPAQWRTAILKRGVTDLAKEYDYIVGM